MESEEEGGNWKEEEEGGGANTFKGCSCSHPIEQKEGPLATFSK